MKHGVSTLLVALAAAAPSAYAQPSALNETQLLGRQVFAQAAGNDEVMRAFIVNGSERMPAFKYYLKPAEIDAIIAYVRTVPVPAPDPQKQGEAR